MPEDHPLRHAPTSDLGWKALLGPATDATTAGLVVQDADGIVRASNVAARAILGVARPEEDSLIGQGLPSASVLVDDDGTPLPREKRPTAIALSTGRVQRDVRLGARREDGTRQWLSITVVPLFAEGSERPWGAVTSFNDVTSAVDAQERLAERERQLRRQHAQLEEAQKIASLGNWERDPETGQSWFSDGLRRVFGVGPDDPSEGTDGFQHLVHPEDAEDLRAALEAAGRTGEPFETTYRLIRPDGEERVMLVRSGAAERQSDGRIARIWGTTQDVTDIHAARASRRQAERLFRVAFDHAPIGMCLTDLDQDRGRILRVNPAMGELLGYDDRQLLGGTTMAISHPDDLAESFAKTELLRSGQAARVHFEKRYLHRDGHVVWALCSSAAVLAEDGRPRYAVTQVLDITERKRFEGQLQHLADHDALTGLFNRRRFEQELERVLAEAERYNRCGAVLVLDLDGFKYVNDTMGHAAGDDLIARLAATLRRELRETDVLGRLGGDEFCVILPEADAEQARGVADKLLRAVERDGVVADEVRQARVTASAGLALFARGDGLSAEELLVDADVAMYDAKEAGRNQAATHRGPEGEGRHVSRLAWLERIHRALADGDFELHAQPIVALAEHDGERPPTFELLLRMRGDDGELVPPAAFLHIAERFDIIGDIDRWVLGEAVALLRREHADGRDVSLSVNLSGRTIGDAAFSAWLEHLLIHTPVPDGRLIVEITETAAIVNLERARALAATLRRLGCRLALDDFGAGFASFTYLKHLHFDILKIDGEFVRGLRDNATDRLVAEAVVAIARGLGTPSLAEFVTDADLLDDVRALGVDFAQGFHLGRPVPVQEALDGLRAV
jgi:diguanylate cyclase (GGDEF)-like protein/PAS domain S-box-containing protein